MSVEVLTAFDRGAPNVHAATMIVKNMDVKIV